MNEETIIESIEQIVSSQTNAYEIKVIEREFSARTEYVAKIGLIAKEGLIDLETIKLLVKLTMSGEYDDLKLDGTKLNMKNLDYDILVISAKINLV